MPEASDRVDLTLVIDSVDELYSGVAPRLCPDGLFIETEDPASAGSAVGFRVVLADGVVLIQGWGTVLWTRLPGSIEGPPGMAVQFGDINGDTRETIDAVIDAHLSTGGELFDLDGRGIRDVYPTDVLDQSTQMTAASPRWLPDAELGGLPAGAWTGRATAADAGDDDTGVVDLRFEEAISGLTQGGGGPDPGEVGAIDQAIAAAVIAPATGDVPAGDEPADSAAGVSWEDGNGDQIPDILDEWREELRIASPKPDQVRTGSGSGFETAPWESLLPFLGDDDSLRDGPGTAPRPDRRVSSARRSTVNSVGWNRLWLVLPGALVILTIGAVVLLIGGGPEVPDEAIESAPVPVVAAQIEESEGEVTEGVEPKTVPTVAVASSSAAPAAIVTAVEWSSEPGATEVVIRGNGPFDPGQVDASRLTDPPRVLVRLRRIGKPYAPIQIEVGTPELAAVRIGHHPELRPATLYVVLDLTTPTVSSTDALRVDGNVARVTVRSAGR